MIHNTRADEPNLRRHMPGCECWRCELRSKMGVLAWQFTQKMLAAAKDGNRGAQDAFCGVVERANGVLELIQDTTFQDEAGLMAWLMHPQARAA